METTIQIISILSVIATLMGWLVKKVINHFIHANNELVKQNQANVVNFVNTINHNQTKINNSIAKLAKSIDKQTEVFKQVIK